VPDPVEKRQRLPLELALGIAVAMVGAIALQQSWNAWLDPIIDAGRDLYIPEQIRSGTKLYVDVRYYYPPLAPYLLALLTSVLGSSLSVYAALGVAVAVMTATTMWWIARSTAGPIAAATAVFLFMTFNMAGPSGWGNNYIFPYAHPATFSILFLVAALASFLAWAYRGKRALFAHLGFSFAIAAMWTKLEVGVYAGILLLAVAVLHRLPWRWMVAYLLVTIGSLLLGAAYFGSGSLRENVLPSSVLGQEAARLFYRRVAGLTEWPVNVLWSVRGALLIAALGCAVAALDREWRAGRRIVIVGSLAAAMTWVTYLLGDESFFRAWSVIQLILVPFALRRPREPLLLLLLVSLMSTSRIYLLLAPYHYGFIFTVPLHLLIGYVLFQWLPDRGAWSRQAALLWIPLILVLGLSALMSSRRVWKAYDSVVTTRRGLYRDNLSERAQIIRALLDHLERTKPRSLVVMPEGLTINYFAGILNPTSFHTFTPAEIAGPETERVIVAEMEASPPERIVLLTRPVTEFGHQSFGGDYGREIMAWMATRYAVERSWKGPRFTLILLRRVS
jgi:hypothetical protein